MRVTLFEGTVNWSRRMLLKAGTASSIVRAIGPAFAAAAPVVATKAGRVRGYVEDGVSIFLGVRYGADTATTRFAAPRAPEPWSAIADATRYGASAPPMRRNPAARPQAAASTPAPATRPITYSLLRSFIRQTTSSEDCLFLNVWTPGVADGKRRPVMVWFHGGGFVAGNGSAPPYEGKRLARRGDVVVITVNHRLNLFGHLFLGDYGPQFADSGNAGLLDLVQALQWVRDNAEAFGGDPGRVTIFGQSGGGAKVTSLMAMDAAKGLFHRAVVESGAWLKVIEREEAARSAKSVVEALGLTPETIGQIRTMPIDKIQQAAAQSGGAGSGPVLDGKTLQRHPFTPDAPPQSRTVPLLIGINRTETINLTGSADPEVFELTWETLPAKLQKSRPGLDIVKIIANYRALHPQYTPADVYLAATTDSSLLRGAVAEAERKAAQGGAPVYFYMVDWHTPVDGGRWRTPHSVEIAFVFDNVANTESMVGPDGPEQQKMVEEMSSAWIAFAHNGDPNTPVLPRWPAFELRRRPAMVFGLPPKIVNDPHGTERTWFKDLPMGPMG